jgi:hypothetical protein
MTYFENSFIGRTYNGINMVIDSKIILGKLA